MELGAKRSGRGLEFVVWAPWHNTVSLRIAEPHEETIPMHKGPRGYWTVSVENARPGTLYFYQLGDQRNRPDPASHFQPDGVHGPSEVVDHGCFQWDDSHWTGIPVAEMIIYELHVGTFTPQGTLKSITPRLDKLAELGVNALEIMPVAQFPGTRNWGYDGVYPYAVQNTYGGPAALKDLVNECHREHMAVILDVVYNHLGSEGNYLADFGPYFTEKYRTPWGKAINFDGAFSDEVRNFFIENALFWFRNYHIDALRLDAVHAIVDMSARPFLLELKETADAFSHKRSRRHYLIAESDLNDPRVLAQKEYGGYNIDAQWLDDLHHALHTLLTSERYGYYLDFGRIQHLVTALLEGFVYSGQRSEYRSRRHGAPSKQIPPEKFIAFAQNHDQVGNRMLGERLSSLTSFEALKLAAGIVLLSPYVPLIFMGEEYGEENPFLYFTDHSDVQLVEAVRRGRIEEFKAFQWKREPPDAQSQETHLRSKIDWEKRTVGMHNVLLEFYSHLIKLRKTLPALRRPCRQGLEAWGSEAEKLVFMRRSAGDCSMLAIFNFSSSDAKVTVPLRTDTCRKILDSAETQWGGPGSSVPASIARRDQVEMKALSFLAVLQEGEADE